ncbi:MAG: sulfotransferase [Nitratireductor sp.]|nr:sulfotransferase [Nitratireductor sp.]
MQLKARDLTTMQRMSMMRQAEAILQRDPRQIDALLTMASLVGMEHSSTQALDYLKRALAVRKKDTDILQRLVSASLEAQLYDEARKYNRKLCELEPRNPNHLRSMGMIHENQGRSHQAIEYFVKALKLVPDSAKLMHDIGRAYALAGEHEKSIDYYNRSIKADPDYGMALYSLSSAKKFTADEAAEFVSLANGAAERSDNPMLQANLYYACGKVLDDAKQPNEAFPFFAKANELRIPEGGCRVPPFLKNSVSAITRPYLEMRRAEGNPSRQPVFILGMPRSGTTLTESLCGAHSQITAGDEQMYMTSYSRHFGRDSDVEGAYRQNLEKLTGAEIRELADDYLKRCEGIAGDTPHFTDKLPHNFINVGFIALLFPNAKIIHVRRHPIDNCFSIYSNSMQDFHNRYKADMTNLGIYYRQYLQLMDHWRKVLPNPMHEVYYEDLVANTEFNARAMIDYLGLEWEDGVMDRTGSQRSVKTLSQWQVRQPVYQTSRGKWRQYEKHLAPLIEALGPNVAAYEAELANLESRDAAQ